MFLRVEVFFQDIQYFSTFCRPYYVKFAVNMVNQSSFSYNFLNSESIIIAIFEVMTNAIMTTQTTFGNATISFFLPSSTVRTVSQAAQSCKELYLLTHLYIRSYLKTPVEYKSCKLST